MKFFSLKYLLTENKMVEGHQARQPSQCLKGPSYGERLDKEAFSSPATRHSTKDSERAITPAAEAACVPGHLGPPGSPQAKQLHYLHAQISLGQNCHGQKISCFCMPRVTSVVPVQCPGSLCPCRLQPARLLCQGGVFPGKNTGAYWPISTGCHTLLGHYIPCCLSRQLP